MMNWLHKLPSLDNYLMFSCRHCELLEIESAAFMNTPNIIRLDLSWNRLTAESLHPDIFRGVFSVSEYEPIMLEELDLSHNTIHALERKLFEHLPYLKTLSLAHNLITHIDSVFAEALSALTKLEHLDLSHTGISIMPNEVLANKPNMRELLLYSNQYEEVPESIKLASSLKSLYIGDNPITSLESRNFEGLTHLVHLNISYLTELTTIAENTFEHLDALEVLLSRGSSQLRVFNLTQLQHLVHLRELDVSNCNLTTLIYYTTEEEQFPKLRSLKLENNNWNCDCDLHEALNILEHHGSRRFQSDDEARCRTPKETSGLLLMDFYNGPFCHRSEAVRKVPRIPIYEQPRFLRPKSILISVAAVLSVIAIGLVVGFAIVQVKKQWRKNDLGFVAPVRYSTVRSSVSSVTNTTVTS